MPITCCKSCASGVFACIFVTGGLAPYHIDMAVLFALHVAVYLTCVPRVHLSLLLNYARATRDLDV